MRAPIAKIRIAAGNPGWYDPLTNIHLTITRPDAFVYEGQNVTNIKTAVSFKLVHVVEGELEPIKESPITATEKVEEKKKVREVIKKSTKTEKKVEEVKTEEVKVEEDAPVVEEKPKKTTKKKDE